MSMLVEGGIIMKKWSKKIVSAFMALTMLAGTIGLVPMDTYAADENSYLVLGADLSETEKAAVLKELGVDSADLANYNVITITNAEEKSYLGEYIDAGVIGSRSLSSALITKKSDGSGIKVSTKNITYCTTGMYRNALITAGVEDAEVKVAGPFELSGTAALVGVVKAYGAMTGESVSEASIDAAVNELVTTGEISEILGDSEKTEQLMALAKQYIAENDFDSKEDIEKAINDAASELNITLTEEDMAKIQALMTKISALDIDKEALKQQAVELYDNLKDIGINFEDAGFRAKAAEIISDVWDIIKGIFS